MCLSNDPKFNYCCRDTLELLDLHVISLEELSLDERHEVPKHLSRCQPCRKEYAGLKHAHDWLIANRDYLITTGFFGNGDKETMQPTTGKSPDERMEERFRRRMNRVLIRRKRRERIAQIRQIAKPITAVAAGIILIFGLWTTLDYRTDSLKPPILADVKNAQVTDDAPRIELISDSGAESITTGQLITAEQVFKRLRINGNRQIVLNHHTALSIEPLKSNQLIGCVIILKAGRIQAHVEPDGHPFEVLTPHGKAVITGTVFDVSVTNKETTLIVAEGSVRFESSQGRVDVGAGFQSTLQAQSRPSSPTRCDAKSLLAWANGTETNPAIEKSLVDSDYANFAETLPLQLSYPGRPIDLESLDYEEWVESKRVWFKGQFPWIFELQQALIEKALLATSHQSPATVTIPDYPELLLESGDLWQTVYPERFYRIIPVTDAKSLAGLATEFGLGDSWLTQGTGSVNGSHSPQHGMVFGLASLEKWLLECRKIQNLCESGKDTTDLDEYSQAMAEYMEHTRVLAWLCIRNGQLPVLAEYRETILSLLKGQVEGVHVIKTAWGKIQMMGGGDSTHATYHGEIVEAIVAIMECEREIEGMHGTLIINSK